MLFGQLMTLAVERFRRSRGKGGQPDPAGGVAAGSLKIADLLDQRGLTRAYRAHVQGIDMMQHPYHHLESFRFPAPCFFHLKLQSSLLTVIELCH